MKAFAGDRFLFGTVATLCARYKVQTIIETGTLYGDTARAMSVLAERVFTIDFHNWPLNLPENVTRIMYKSPDGINLILLDYRPNGNILFFLDAHTANQGTPVLEELKAISDNEMWTSPIIIHDFKVPDTDLGFDVYDDKPLDSVFINDAVQPFMEHGYSPQYNFETEGDRRGALMLLPPL